MMRAALVRCLCLCGLLLVAGCGGGPQQAGGLPQPVADAPPVRDPRFVASLPDGPLTMPADTAEAAQALAEAQTQQGAAALPAFAKAAKLGSTEARFTYAFMLISGMGQPEQLGTGFDIMLALAKQGHGAAALYLSVLSQKTDNPAIHQHGPYWANIARRAGNETALTAYAKQLEELRAKGDLPPGSGNGDYFDSAITFTQPLKGSYQGVPLEYKTAAALLPGWRRWRQSLHQIDGKAYDVLDMANEDGQVVKLYFDITAWFAKEVVDGVPQVR